MATYTLTPSQLKGAGIYNSFEIPAGGGTPSLSNTKSIYFDGIDAYVNQNLSTTSSTGSVSVWIKPDLTNNRAFVVFDNGGYRNYLTIISKNDGTLNAQCRINPTVQWSLNTDNSVLSSTSWTHVVVTHNGTEPKIYIDGTLVPQTFLVSTNKSTWWNTLQPTLMRLGWFNINGYGRNNWAGIIDEFSLYETELSQSQITAIYNNGLPTSLTAYNSLVWLRCGDGDTQPTLINHGSSGVNAGMGNPDPFSTDVPGSTFSNTKSILLDGVDDYVDMNTTIVGTTFSISAWFKVANTTDLQPIISTRENSISTSRGIDIYVQSDILTFRIYKNGGTSVTQSFTDLGWNHVLYVYDGTTLEGFLNGVSIGSTSASYSTSTQTLKTGIFIPSSLYAETYIDEVALFYTDESANASTIYNSGVPNNISSLSPLSWWRCGDSDTSPILTDNGSGGNDGTMQNFTTFSTDVPT